MSSFFVYFVFFNLLLSQKDDAVTIDQHVLFKENLRPALSDDGSQTVDLEMLAGPETSNSAELINHETLGHV